MKYLLVFMASLITALSAPLASVSADNPYFQAAGGDVVAGVSFSTQSPDTACGAAPHNSTAGVVGWNTRAAPYNGAGVQYATYALDLIQDFATNQGNGSGPASLSFANVNQGNLDVANGLFGGMFGTISQCVDYWGARPHLGSLPNIGSGSIGSLPSDVYGTSGNLTIHDNGGASPNTIANGTRLTIYVNGHLAIADNITYAGSGGWTSPDQIPSVRFIVRGSIYIDAAVTQLDGLYVAVPDSGYVTQVNKFNNPRRGTISTCSSGFHVHDPTNSVSNGMVATCANPLTVNGSLVGNQIWLLRTFGSLDAGTGPAETINYSPEMWLAPGSSKSYDLNYKSIVGLPPVL